MSNRPKITADQRRALELLADAGLQDCTGATLLAHGVRLDVLADLVRAGLVIAYREPMNAGQRQIDVARMRITNAGRRELTAPSGQDRTQ
jgi:hypothetical protein